MATITPHPPEVLVPMSELDCRGGRAEPLLRRVFSQPQVAEAWRDLAILDWFMEEPPHSMAFDDVRKLTYEWRTVESHRLRVTMEQNLCGPDLSHVVLRSVDLALFTRAPPIQPLR